jgi:glycosyltransferase involved in cell wall biosynthesis
MKILFVADVSIAQVIGGAERVLYEQSTRLAQRGHNIHILTRRLPNHENDHAIIKGVNEWRYDYNACNTAAFLKTTWSNAKKLFEFLYLKYKLDCINYHQPFSAMGINSSEMSKSLVKIYTCHSLSFEEFSSRNGKVRSAIQNGLNFIKIQVRKKIESNGLSKSDEIVTLSEFTQEKLADTYNIPREKIHIIPGGTDLKKFHPVSDKTEIRSQLNIPQNIIVLFTVRNLVQRMGLENLIIAFNELIKKCADIKLVIGGKGPLENGLIALARSFNIEDKVKFAGFIPEDQLPLYYQMADLFVLPTKELEGFGLVTLEAMASGLPVIGTPIGGTKEILGKFDAEFLFEDTQSDSIAKLALEKYHIIKNNPQRWKQISDRCRQFVERHYSWEQNVNSLEKLFLSSI